MTCMAQSDPLADSGLVYYGTCPEVDLIDVPCPGCAGTEFAHDVPSAVLRVQFRGGQDLSVALPLDHAETVGTALLKVAAIAEVTA